MFTFVITDQAATITIAGEAGEVIADLPAGAALDPMEESETDRVRTVLAAAGWSTGEMSSEWQGGEATAYLTGQVFPDEAGSTVVDSVGDDETSIRLDVLTSGMHMLTVVAGAGVEESFFADEAEAQAAMDALHFELDGTTPDGECFFDDTDTAHGQLPLEGPTTTLEEIRADVLARLGDVAVDVDEISEIGQLLLTAGDAVWGFSIQGPTGVVSADDDGCTWVELGSEGGEEFSARADDPAAVAELVARVAEALTRAAFNASV